MPTDRPSDHLSLSVRSCALIRGSGCINRAGFTLFTIALFRAFSLSTLPPMRPYLGVDPAALERPRCDAYSPGRHQGTTHEMTIMSLSAGRFLRLAAACAAVFLLAGCGLFTSKEDEYVERPPEELYNTGLAYMQDQE